MAREGDRDLHDQVFELLIDKVREDRFPSVTMLDMIEARLQGDDVETYTSVLMDKVREDRYPSIDILRRLHAFI